MDIARLSMVMSQSKAQAVAAMGAVQAEDARHHRGKFTANEATSRAG